MGKIIGGAIAAALAGGLGGALVGIGESLLVTVTSGAADEYWLFFFGILAYGGFGATVGVGVALAWQIIRRGRAGDFELAQLGAGLAVLVPVLAVARYHVAQRIFREGLVLTSSSGLIAYAAIFAGSVLAALLAVALVRILYRFVGRAGPLVGFATLAGIGFLIGALSGEAEEQSMARRAAPARVQGKPNIILIVADTLRSDVVKWDDGDGGFARLGRVGVVFESAYAQASWTRPSVASILTAQYPSSHGTVHKMDFLSDRVLTLAEALRDEGYWTTAFTTNINVAPIFNLSQGFEEFEYIEPSFYFGASDSATKLAIYKGLRTARERFFAGRVFFEHFYQDADVVNDRVAAWLAESPPEPFFLFVHYMDPHDPYFEMPYNGRGVARVMNPSPPSERADELRSQYLQGVRYLEVKLAEMLDGLKAGGVFDRSIIVVTSDHGEEFSEHDGWWHGTSLYEEQIHVPLVVKKPGSGGAERRADRVRSIDIGPTVMGLAGLRAPGTFQGVDVFRQRVEEPIIAEEELEGNRIVAILDGPWKLIKANPGNPRGLQTVELYNLESDPLEQHNLAASEPQRVSELEAKLRELME